MQKGSSVIYVSIELNHLKEHRPVGQVMSPLNVAVGVIVADAAWATGAAMATLAMRPERERIKVVFILNERTSQDLFWMFEGLC